MIKSLTSLRGIFILFIFFHHCMNLYIGGGTMAVAFFFILGGFSMTLGYKDRVLLPEFSYKQYLIRRCIKFYPLHWLCLMTVLPLTLYNGITFITNAALVQSWIPIKSFYFSYNMVSWYLADTMFFALLFPFLFNGIVRMTTKGRIRFTVAMLVAYALIVILLPTDMYHAILYISPYVRTSDFVFGMLLAFVYLDLKEKTWTKNLFSHNGKIWMLTIILLIVLLVYESSLLTKSIRMIAPVFWPLVAMLIVLVSLLEENGGGILLQHHCLQRFGELSFTFFLTHQIVLRYLTIEFDHFHFDNTIMYIILSLVITIMVSLIVERYILKNVTQWLTKRIQPYMTVQ